MMLMSHMAKKITGTEMKRMLTCDDSLFNFFVQNEEGRLDRILSITLCGMYRKEVEMK